MDDEILKAFAKNVQHNKAGVGNISAFAGPILVTKEGICASWIFRED